MLLLLMKSINGIGLIPCSVVGLAQKSEYIYKWTRLADCNLLRGFKYKAH